MCIRSNLALPGMRRDMKAWCSSSGNYHRHKEEEEDAGMGVEFAVLLMATSCSHFHMNSALCSYLHQSARLISCSSCPLNCLNLFFSQFGEKCMVGAHSYIGAVEKPSTITAYKKKNSWIFSCHIFTFLGRLSHYKLTSSKFISSGLSQGLKNLPVRCFFRGTTTM